MIRRVDTAEESVRHALNLLDEHCFPADALAEKTGYWWISFQDGEPSGFAGLRRLPREPHIGYLCRVGVLEHCRGQGIQKDLIRVRLAYARRLGMTHVLTDTTADNLPSANSLMGMGFRLYAPAHPWAFESSLYWMREL